MAATIKDLGKVTAYAYAKAAGYTGTEEQFQAIFDEFTENAPGLIDRMDTAVARAEAAVTEIDATVQDAVDDAVEEATASAVATANQAVTDAQAAQTAAEGAVTQANNAVTQANAAVTAAQAAQSAAEDAAESFVIDNTLTVSGAAADAKKTGDEISDLMESFSVIEEKVDLVTSASDATESSIYLADGTTTTNSVYKSTDFIPCTDYSEIEYYLCGGTTTSPAMALLSFFDSEHQFVYAVQAVINNGFVESAIPVPANATYLKAICRVTGTSVVPCVRGIKKNTIQSDIVDLTAETLSQLEEVPLTLVFDDPIIYSNPTTPISGGSSTSGTRRRMSRRVDCSHYDTIKYGVNGHSTNLMIIFYDGNLAIVGYKYGIGANNFQEGEVSVPATAKYVSFTWIANSPATHYAIGVNNNTAKIKTDNLYILDDVSPSYTEEVVNINMTREQFVAAFDAKRQDYADLCLASIRGFPQLYGTHSFEEAYLRINRFFRREVYVEGISKKLLYDRINAAFTIPIRRFQDAKINSTIPCDFSFQIGDGQGGEPSLIVSADGGELWAYSYGSRYTSIDGTTWGDKTNKVLSDGARAPQHQGLSVVDETIFMFGRDPDNDHNLKMYTSPLTDGINFTYKGVPISIGHDFGDGLHIDNWGNSFLTKVDDTYYLFIEGRQDNDGNFWDIYCVTCTDPFVDNGDGTIGNWQNCGVAPVIANTNRSIANGNPSIAVGADNRPIRIDGKYFMYYHQTNNSYSYILRAYSYDLINWTYESSIFDNRNKPTAGESQSSNADHSLIEFKGKTYFAYTHDINTTRTPHLMMMIDDRPFREILKLRP